MSLRAAGKKGDRTLALGVLSPLFPAALNPAGPDGKLSLREAIAAANLHSGADTIVLPAGHFTITRTGGRAPGSGPFTITDALIIQGAGALATTIDAAGTGRAFTVTTGSPALSKGAKGSTSVDQRGQARDPNTPHIGAFEAPG